MHERGKVGARMRARAGWVWLGAAAAVAASAAAIEGCQSHDCEDNINCPPPSGYVCEVDDSGFNVCGSADATVIEGGDAGDAALPDAEAGPLDSTVRDASDSGPVDAAPDTADVFVCDTSKSPHDDACVLQDALGVFVAPPPEGSDTAAGTMAHPFATIGHALASLGGRSRVYVCNGTYPEAVVMPPAANVFGGLACLGGDGGIGWSYVGSGAQVTAPANEIALTVSSVTSPIAIQDMSFASPDATGEDDAGNGRSSIGALVSSSSVTFTRCTFAAGKGANGADGGTGTNYSGATAPAGQAPDDAGTGGPGGAVICSDGTTSSAGGKGGDAHAGGGLAGADGGAMPLPPSMPGYDGTGGPGGLTICTAGTPGANGVANAAGIAAAKLGTLSATGWTPMLGGAGANGNPGQGGGGGGGKSATGGTGGGSGGCGGAAGAGGRGGGASIALACFEAAVTLDACSTTAGAAGAGGSGSDGEPGQAGGAYGSAVGPCLGGYGGNGAGGSGGAGGTGGVSSCVLYSGTIPSGAPSCTAGAAGAPGTHGHGGAGGDNGQGNAAVSGNDGADGLAGVSETIGAAP